MCSISLIYMYLHFVGYIVEGAVIYLKWMYDRTNARIKEGRGGVDATV